jgi:FkbH-like protein
MNIEPKLSYFLTEAQNIEKKKFEKKIKIAILSSFTINGLAETLQVKSAQKNIECKTFLGGYNQYNQEILDKNSNLYKFLPDITFLILDVRNILGNSFYFPYSLTISERQNLIKEKTIDIVSLAKTFTANSNSKLVVTNFSIPKYSSYGLTETKEEYGFHEMINSLNNNLIYEFRNMTSTYLYDFNAFVSKYGERHVFNFQQYLFGDIKISFDYIPYLANDLMSYVIATLGLSKKCIVLDLDNTLWGGIVGEEGFDGITLGPQPPGNAYLEFQRHLLALFQRGIILAINSKNNTDDALKVIRDHPYMVLREENFASMKINWNDKVVNMKEIAEELNIGLDSIVFFDDDPVNREYMKTNLQQVKTVDLPSDPAQYPQVLQEIGEFDVLNITKEDAKRGQMYIQQRKRKELEHSSLNLHDFLKNLDIKITIKTADNFTIRRISQLTLKTNQFNLTTRRYQEEDIRQFANDDKIIVGCAQVEDKFGDNGVTGVFIVKKDQPTEWILDSFLLSCRVIGREVEKGILNHIISIAKKNGVKRLKAQFIPTQKNKPIESFLPDCGFKKEDDHWVYDLNIPFNSPNYLEVISE